MEDVTSANPEVPVYELYMDAVSDAADAAADDYTLLDMESFTYDAIKANWVLNQMANWQAEQARIKAAADARIAQLKRLVAWFQLRFEAELKGFAEQELIKTGKKTLHLPCGAKLNFRQVNPALKVVNPEEFLAWCEAEMPEAVKVEKSALISVVKTLVPGKIVPGTEMTEAENRFYMSY